ncbi:SEL1-like repeat protein [Legionella spiritensis]|uniref:TPR repeat-containing protein n=1 Tax=Legionella spiritensis TaxID=452 RepID=A0A0W0ZAP4_LEGSP|nr:SEL1-like repeat protein [Legionella spiritensis]KTD66193.1 TPR repeat-containing protein [Legionella spiritensis]SNV35161.1 TPR repeat protein, SEL1 subfamily [Legionella spiritensis]
MPTRITHHIRDYEKIGRIRVTGDEPVDLEAIDAFLMCHSDISKIDLSHNDFAIDTLYSILHRIFIWNDECSRTVRRLDLSHNNLGEKPLAGLLDTLRIFKKIKYCNLSNNAWRHYKPYDLFRVFSVTMNSNIELSRDDLFSLLPTQLEAIKEARLGYQNIFIETSGIAREIAGNTACFEKRAQENQRDSLLRELNLYKGLDPYHDLDPEQDPDPDIDTAVCNSTKVGEALYNIGRIYCRLKWYGDACYYLEKIAGWDDGRRSDVQTLLGVSYYHGRRTDINQKQAWECFKQASEKESAKALYNLSWLYLFGEGCERDFDEAIACLEKAADMNLAQAQYNLGYFYLKGFTGFIRPDTDIAVEWLKKAAKQGHIKAFEFLKGIEHHFDAWQFIRDFETFLKKSPRFMLSCDHDDPELVNARGLNEALWEQIWLKTNEVSSASYRDGFFPKDCKGKQRVDNPSDAFVDGYACSSI